MAKMTLNQLTSALKMNEFEARSDEALQAEAEARVAENYDVMRSAAQQRQSAVDAAYQMELDSLAETLAAGNQTLSAAAARSNAAIDKYINTRSIQRSSYGAGSQASTAEVLKKAAAALQQQYDTASSGVENSRILLAQQLAATLAQYDKDYLTDVQAYIDEQKQLDYDRKVEADAAYNELQMALYEYGQARSGSSSRRSTSSSGTSSSSTSGSTGLFESLGSGSKSSGGIPVITGYTKGGTPIVSSYYDPQKITANQYKK